jgi:hypothetical protein
MHTIKSESQLDFLIKIQKAVYAHTKLLCLRLLLREEGNDTPVCSLSVSAFTGLLAQASSAKVSERVNV